MTSVQDPTTSANNLEACLKCTLCTVYCPVSAVNPDYPGPKQAGPDGERYRLKDKAFYDDILRKCINCKRCEVACPSGVRPATIIQNARIRFSKHRPGLRDRMLASTDFMGGMATMMAPIVNSVLSIKPVKLVMHHTLGIDSHRQFPAYTGEKFTTWWRHSARDLQSTFAKSISYFHGCYVEYNFPKLGRDFVALMNAVGYGVFPLDGERCCGVAKIANGLIDEAREDAAHNIEVIRKAVEEHHRPVVATSSTCVLTMREEYPELLHVDNSDVRADIFLATRFLHQLVEKGEIKLAFRKDFAMKAAYHTPCHMARLGWGVYTIEMLRMIPGLELTVLPQECCGIAGTYGFKKENYEYSQAIGQKLFENIDNARPDIVITDCETCKWQIEMSTGIPVFNPISILAEALDFEETRKLNGLSSL